MFADFHLIIWVNRCQRLSIHVLFPSLVLHCQHLHRVSSWVHRFTAGLAEWNKAFVTIVQLSNQINQHFQISTVVNFRNFPGMIRDSLHGQDGQEVDEEAQCERCGLAQLDSGLNLVQKILWYGFDVILHVSVGTSGADLYTVDHNVQLLCTTNCGYHQLYFVPKIFSNQPALPFTFHSVSEVVQDNLFDLVLAHVKPCTFDNFFQLKTRQRLGARFWLDTARPNKATGQV